jgi:hypothetical protein
VCFFVDNAFHAAKEAGCQRVVYASSVNAVLGYEGVGRDGETSGSKWDVPVKPTNVYGATKCWGEALARVFSTDDTHGGLPKEGSLSCICVRIGSPRWDPSDFPPPEKLYEPHWGFSPRDCGHLFERCVDVPDVQFAIVAGISRHVASWMDVEHSCKVLGYSPKDGTVHAPGAQAKL